MLYYIIKWCKNMISLLKKEFFKKICWDQTPIKIKKKKKILLNVSLMFYPLSDWIYNNLIYTVRYSNDIFYEGTLSF